MSATIEDSAPISTRNGHSRCLLCGDLNPRSLNLLFSPLEDGSVDTRFTVGPELQALTGDLHVRFVKPVPIGAVLGIRAWVLLSYPPLYQLRAEIEVDRQRTAWAEAKFMEHRFSR